MPGTAPVAVPAFDVISVKPDSTNGGMMRIMFTGDGLSVTNLPVHMLITEGYQLNDDEIFGEPAWARTDRFDMEAKVAGPDAATLKNLTFDQRRTMFQQVLTDRFKMTAHRETRQLPVYILVVTNGGPKFKESVVAAPTSANPCPERAQFWVGPGSVTATNTKLPFMLQFLSRQLGRTIIDQTGLTGNYDFKLQWNQERPSGLPPGAAPGFAPPGAAPASPDADAGPSIFTALEEQLGLKLESSKGPVNVLVIDHIEKPSAN